MNGKLEEQFQKAIGGIREYASRPEVRASSIINTDFDAYQQIVGLGAEALKPLRQLMANKEEPRWYVLLASCEILRNYSVEFEIPNEIQGNLDNLEKYVCDIIDGAEAL